MGPAVRLLLLGAFVGLKVGWVTGATGGLAICVCDLSPGICDINCCCDPDCNSTDPTSVFTSCLPGSTKAQTQVCLYSWLIFRSNTPYSTVLVPSSSSLRTPELFCVIPADSTLNYFVTPQTVNGASFSSLSQAYRGPSFSPASVPVPTFSSFYKEGDPILTISADHVLGVLRQPAPVGAQSICSDRNPARFLQSGSAFCLRLISNLSASCLSDRSLRASSYYRNISVLRVPADPANNTDLNVMEQVADSPTLRGDICEDVVSQVMYTVLYDGTQGITGVTVHFSLVNVTSSQLLNQSFTVLYQVFVMLESHDFNKDSESITAEGSSVQRSGNPGYLVGFPVLTDTESLSLLTQAGDGSCSRSPLAFGVNAVSGGCTLMVDANESCSNLTDRAYNLLLGANPPRLVATFGNAGTAQSGDWTSIIFQNCSTEGAGDCRSGCLVPVHLHVQILWAEVGLVSNPEAQVQGVRFLFSCRSVMCLDVIELQTQASFTDITRRGPSPRAQPAITDREPLDFFFPFKSNRAEKDLACLLLQLSIWSLTLCL